jgi:hypothetical protein
MSGTVGNSKANSSLPTRTKYDSDNNSNSNADDNNGNSDIDAEERSNEYNKRKQKKCKYQQHFLVINDTKLSFARQAFINMADTSNASIYNACLY